MENPRTKYLLLCCWAVLLVAGIMIQKIPPSQNSSWLGRKLTQKASDTAIKRLNMSMPTEEMYRQLMLTNSDGSALAASDELINYYQQIIEAMPTLAEGYTLLGFCYYHKGDRANAFSMFQKAFYLDPSYFYHATNLSLMYLQAGQAEKAVQLLAAAASINPAETLKTMASSKIYQDILGANKDYAPAAALKDNYERLRHLLDQLHSGRFQDPGIHLRIL